MNKVLGAAATLAAAVLIVGCVESKQDFTLNPDGSGKVVLEMLVEDMPFNMGSQDPPDPELVAKRLAKQILDNSKGIDAWSDVRYERTADERTRFIGTAYFKDFSKVRFQMAQMEGVTLTKDDQGGMVMEFKPKDEGGGAPSTPAAPPEMTEEQIAEQVKAARASYQQTRMMLATVLANMKISMSFLLPGALAEVNGFQKQPSGAVAIAFEGTKMLEVMDQLVADEAYMREQIKAGKRVGGPGGKMDEQVYEKLLGTKGPVRARAAAPLKALFAYDAEMSAAKANYPKMIERLGLDKLPEPPPTPPMPPGFGVPPGMKGEPGGGGMETSR